MGASVVIRVTLIFILGIAYHPPLASSGSELKLNDGAALQPFSNYDSHLIHGSFVGPHPLRKSRKHSPKEDRIKKNQVTVQKLIAKAREKHFRRGLASPSPSPSPSRTYPSPTPIPYSRTGPSHKATPTPIPNSFVSPATLSDPSCMMPVTSSTSSSYTSSQNSYHSTISA